MFKPQRANARTKPMPAPVKGWNARDPIAAMDELFAVNFDNWWPTPSYVMVRKGHTAHATGLPGVVESLMTYNGTSASEMFAASGGGIYDVTSAGAVGAAVASGFSEDYWQHVNVANTGGNFMLLCNGTDSVQSYNGSAWSVPTITGVTSSDLINIALHKRRVWFVEKNSMSGWYLATDAVAGAATRFDFGPLFKKGGHLVAMTSWTIDAGEGADDYFVVITSEGEVAVYKGTDPASANTWAMVGVYSMGAPLGYRCFTKFGGDVSVLTRDGVMPLSKALMSDRVNPSIALTDNIQSEIAKDTGLYGSLNGWEVIQYPGANMLIMNVPISTTQSEQYGMNLITGAWSGTWTGIDAMCWSMLSEAPYFGGNTIVNKFWDGHNDNGSDIDAPALQAFSYFGANSSNKFFKMSRPTIQTDGALSAMTFGINVDYDTESPVSEPSFSPSVYGIWDAGLWDTALWGGGVDTLSTWSNTGKIGYCGAANIRVQTNGQEFRWLSTDHIYETGGFL